MARSLALALYLLVAGRRGSEPEPLRGERPAGTLLWMHIGAGSGRKRLAQLARRLAELRPGLSFLVTAEGPETPDAGGFPAATAADRQPPERTPAITAFLDHWRPDLALFAGASLPPALLAEAHGRAIPLVLADIRIPDMTGYECFCRVLEYRPNVPVIFMTGFGYDPGHSIVKARQNGLQAVLFKPFRAHQLLDELEKALTRPTQTPVATAAESPPGGGTASAV